MPEILWILIFVFIISRFMKNVKRAAQGTRIPSASPRGRADLNDALDALEMARDTREGAEQPEMSAPFMAYEESAREEPGSNDFSSPQVPAASGIQKAAGRPEVTKSGRRDFYCTPEALQHAVVMAEILSPPKALRRR